MKKVLILIIYSFFISFLGHSQIIERFVTPQDLPNLIPGYSQVSTINEQSLSFTFTMQPSPPSPVDGDTTTDGNGPMKYGEVLSVNYSTSNGNYTQTSEGKVWTLSIKVLGGCKNIGLTFTSVNFVSATEMYLYNQSKTVLLGPLKAENLNQSNTFTTGACKDSVITIFIIERNSSTFQSTFNITRLVAGFIDLDDLTNARIMGTECMTSVQCFPEKMIYAHAVARFETGGWLGSGMLINNEENNARPFFLTAYHVVDINDDNQISADEIAALNTASFRFQFWRDACGSNTNNGGIFFSGATLRAITPTHGSSDMALLELTGRRPGLADGVTYLGWNRSTNAPSNNNSYVIHHPRGRDMRLTKTVSVNSYIFGDSYWQAYYQGTGAVAPASSGGPLLNENNQVVGQLYGGWSTCTFSFSDRYGKFSKSWTGGGTNDTRLSNWLSPNQNLSSMNLFDPTSVYVSGSDAVGCTGTKQYSVSNNLFDVNYFWTVTNNLQIVSGQGTQTLTVNRISNGPGTITVNLTSNEGYSRTLIRSKQVYVGLPTSVSFTQKTITCVNTKPYFTGAVASVADATNYAWYAKDESNPNNPFLLKQSENSNTADFPLGNNHGNRYYTIRVVVTTSCGSVQTIDEDGYMYAPACGSGFRIVVSPNPTNSIMSVQLVDEAETMTEKKAAKFYEIQIVNSTGVVLKQFKYSSGETQTNLNLSGLPSNVYLLRLWDGNEWKAVQIMKNN